MNNFESLYWIKHFNWRFAVINMCLAKCKESKRSETFNLKETKNYDVKE